MAESNNYENAMAAYENQIADFRAKFDEIKNFNREQTKGASAFSLVADPLGAHLVSEYGPEALSNFKGYLADKTQGIRDTLSNKVDEVKGRVLQTVEDKVNEIKQKVIDRATGLKDEAQQRAGDLQNEVQGRIGAAQEQVGQTVGDLRQGLTTAQEQVGQTVSDLANAEPQMLDALADTGGRVLSGARGSTIFTDAVQGAQEVPGRLGGLVNELQGRVGGLASEVQQGAQGLVQDVTGTTRAVGTEASGFLQGLRGQVADLGRGIFNDIKGQLTTRAQNVASEITSRVPSAEGVGQQVSDLAPQLAARVSQAVPGASRLLNVANPQSTIQFGDTEFDLSKLLPDIPEGSTEQVARQVGESILPDVRQAVSSIPGINLTPATDAVDTATNAISGLAKGGEALADVASNVVGSATGGIAGGLEGAGEALAEATGAETGGIGAIAGGFLALGGLLASLFGHHNERPPPPPNTSAPQFQAGLVQN